MSLKCRICGHELNPHFVEVRFVSHRGVFHLADLCVKCFLDMLRDKHGNKREDM
jgi:hypothetical protein